MHNGMPYDLIQGQGHGASEVPKIVLFKVYIVASISSSTDNGSWQMITHS